MSQFVKSVDGTSIYYETSGEGKLALVFVHGWGGNCRWWDMQRDAFKNSYQIVQLDLACHGKSDVRKGEWTIQAYAADIQAVIQELQLKQVVLIGHSMSGSNVIQAYQMLPEKVQKIVLVDTLQDLDHMPSLNDATFFFEGLEKDFKGTIETAFAQFMFAKTSPQVIISRVVQDVSQMQPDFAISCLKPFYSTDIRSACLQVKVPVRAINSDLFPISKENNRKYFRDFDCEIIQGVGHYPMLEAADKFSQALQKILKA